MRHAAGELAERLHLLAVRGIGFGLAQRLLRLLLGRDVTARDIDQPLVGGHGPGDPAPAAVLVAEAVLHAHRRHALGQPRACRPGMRGVVGMAQRVDMHRL